MMDISLKDMIEELENNLMINTNHNCQICGSHLELFHKTDFITYKVTESSRCLKCGVTLKNKTHTLH